MPKSERTPPEEFSKTKLKNESEALQVLGKSLVALSKTQLSTVPLGENLRQAILLAQTLKSHEGLRRHMQFIGKLMREVDPEPIQLAMAKIKAAKVKVTQEFHDLEKLRDELISEGDVALQQYMDLYPAADRQQVRQLIRKAQRDAAKGTNTGGAKELFQYLREISGME